MKAKRRNKLLVPIIYLSLEEVSSRVSLALRKHQILNLAVIKRGVLCSLIRSKDTLFQKKKESLPAFSAPAYLLWIHAYTGAGAKCKVENQIATSDQ